MTVDLAFFDTVTMSLHGPEPQLGRARALWQSCLAGASTPDGSSSRHLDLDVTDLALGCAEINRAAVGACPHPAAHAATLSVAGVGVVVPAVSGAGKSTLAAALCVEGAGYLSDEALVMDDGGRCVPYPKPLALSDWSMTALGLAAADSQGEHGPSGAREFLLAPSSLASVVTTPVALGHIVLPTRGSDGPPQLVALPRRDGLAALLDMSFNHYRDPRRYLVRAALAVGGAQVWRLHYADPRQAARLLVTRLGPGPG